jgi:hypothetical protein
MATATSKRPRRRLRATTAGEPPPEFAPQGFDEMPEESPEVPDLTPDPEPEPAEEPAFDVAPAPLERPPGAAELWAILREVRDKVEVLWTARENARRFEGGTVLWHCTAILMDKQGLSTGVECDFTMMSTPPGQAPVPLRTCPIHGTVPFRLA